VTAGPPLTIGFLGRIPPAIGGAGLERQIARTAAALERRGHRVVPVDAVDEPFEVLHAFSSEPSVWHHLRHWTRNEAPLVVTPVVVVSPGRDELALRLGARLRTPLTGARMRREIVARADAVVVASEYERGVVERALGADPANVVTIGNAADEVESAPLPAAVPDGGYVLLLGSVSKRKGQTEVLEALAGVAAVVVAGGWAGAAEERPAWERLVERTGAVWLGEVSDPAVVAGLQERARAMVHLSSAEVQSLAVVECVARDTPVIASDIPSHRELAARHPSLVRVVPGAGGVAAALDRLADTSSRAPGPPVPTWTDVAEELEAVYRRVRSRPA
jgi:glycosyltransferase involved in cell wall biosynthesis